MRVWLHILTVLILTGSMSVETCQAFGLLDSWAGGNSCPPAAGRGLGGGLLGGGLNFNPMASLQGLASGGVASPCGRGGYPAAAAPFGPGGPPNVPNQWAGGGSGYANLGGTCCGPHWWDFMAQAVFLKREFRGNGQGLMSEGIRGLAPPNIVQSTQSNDFNFEPGFKVGGRYQMSAVHSLEGIYMGGLDWDDRDVVTSTMHDLYSAFSDFGNSPFGGFEDSDQASISTLDYDSELDSAEVNYRRVWALQDQKTSGSLMCGFRYVRIDESLNHRIDVLPHFDPISMVNRFSEFTDYNIQTTNNMFGFQVGAELVSCLSEGIFFGGEFKGGLFANRAEQDSILDSTTLTEAINEASRDVGASFMTDANVFLLWQFHPMWKMRVGYEVLFFSQVATAGGNYNANPPNINGPNSFPIPMPLRVVDVDDHDTALYHGFHLGVEFGW